MYVVQSTFAHLYEKLALADASTWAAFARSSECEREFPPNVARGVSAFEQLLVVQLVRPDRLLSAQMQFVCQALGLGELSPPTLTLKRFLQLSQQQQQQQSSKPARAARRKPKDSEEEMEPAGAAPPADETARPTLTPPVLIVLSPGADPSQELQDAAAELLGPARYHQVAMGQGQAELAVKLLRECAQSGALLLH